MKRPEELAAERQAREQEERQARIDLRDVLQTEAGQRVGRRLLNTLKVNEQLRDAADVNWHNAAQLILNDIAAAHPAACVRLMARLRGIGGAELLQTEEETHV